MTRTTKRRLIFGAAALVLGIASVLAQSGREFRRTAIMNGNEVRTVFGNWGVIGQPATQGHRGAWRNDNDGYLGDVSPLVGAEVKWDTLTFHSVVTCPVDRPTQLSDTDPATGKYWTFEPEGGYFNPSGQSVAISNNPATWPKTWPDRMNDATDPGWKGSWNGYFGKKISADLETYFVMDDNNDERFNKAANNPRHIAFMPDSMNALRYGLGLKVGVRALQWGDFLAQDNIFWLYEITNTGTTTYDRVVFGMLVGTYVGVTSTEDYREYSDDWSFYNAQNNITYTGDYGRVISNPLWVGSVGMVGYAFLESPGNPYDGIDNDGDADSTAAGMAAPLFTAASFDSTTVYPGQKLVIIKDDFSRVLYTVPNDSFRIITRGMKDSVWIVPGVTKLAEGNILQRTVVDPTYGTIKVDYANPNAYDGIDNNFNGLIDENYFLHYRQIRKNRNPAGPDLINILRPLHYVDYRANLGTSPTSMIDERRDDLVDNNMNWRPAKDDVGRDGVPNTHDFGENDGLPTSGYLPGGIDSGLPGEPRIDKTDVRESDQIGLTSFFYFAPANQVRLGDDESLWSNLTPGFFDVPSSIQNNKPIGGEDGDFIYGSGYFPLLAGKIERFSLALVYGGGMGGSVDADIADLLKNKQTVQRIYDENYYFPKAPDPPTLTAVAGDRQVTLYWDRKSEDFVDDVLGIKTFEGYKLLKSTLPDFKDQQTITDGSGKDKGYMPLAQWDLKDTISGFFDPNPEQYQKSSGYAFYLGDNTGLQHSYVDVDVQNGRRYYYALQAYSRGDSALGLFPAENRAIQVTLGSANEVVQIPSNVAVVTPNAPVGGYVSAPSGVALSKQSGTVGTGSATYAVLEPAKVTGHTYQVEFLDTQTDGIDNNGNGKIDLQDSTEGTRVTSFYSVRDLTPVVEPFTPNDTSRVQLSHGNIIAGTVSVQNQQGGTVSPLAYALDTLRGTIWGTTTGSLPDQQYTVTYQYYPVFKSQHMQRNPALVENADADNFDGIELVFDNDWTTLPDTSSRWIGSAPYLFSFAPIYSQFTFPAPLLVRGIRKPSDYRIEWASGIVDTSERYDPGFLSATPVNFRIYNLTDSTYIKFIFFDNDGNGVISHLDELWFDEKDLSGRYQLTWNVQFVGKLVGGQSDTTTYPLTSGDELLLRTVKPFRKGDVLRFTTTVPTTNESLIASDLAKIKVVPNPYVTASAFEPPLPSAITSGRGTRKVDFTHIPPDATISIYTSRGDHVITLRHDGTIQDGTVSWNLKTKENLDIAYGVYFYVVQCPAGTKTGKLAIIK